MAEGDGFFPHVLFEDDTDAVQKGFAAGTDVADGAGAVVDHADDHGMSLVQTSVDLIGTFGIRHDTAVPVKRTPFIQKTDFQDIHAGADEALKDIDNVVMTEIPVIDISAVS